ncbi:TPA: hypothetical protein ACN33U_001992 [Vibrio parahaemolyticus]|nr:hypothetical protein [Vibrio parahaemolyticus]
MHWQAYSFVQAVKGNVPQYFYNSKVVEFGSACVNYSISTLFEQPVKYFGVDLTDTQGVDVIGEAQSVNLGSNFDVAVSCECFEHNPYYLETFQNMVSHVRPGGLVLFTCATTGRAEHGTTRTTPEQSPGTQTIGWDYYRNVTRHDFPEELLKSKFLFYCFFENAASQDLYFVGIKKGCTERVNIDAELLYNEVKLHESLSYSFDKLWKGEDDSEFIFDVVIDLNKISHLSLNPYLLENTMPLLIKRSVGDVKIISNIRRVLEVLSVSYPKNPISLYLFALLESSCSNHLLSLQFSYKIPFELRKPELISLKIDALHCLGLGFELLRIFNSYYSLILSAPIWVKVNIANKICGLSLQPNFYEAKFLELCESADDSIELKAILCRYLNHRGEHEKALEILLAAIDERPVPDWVLLDCLIMIERLEGLDSAVRVYSSRTFQAIKSTNFTKYARED